jgi:glutamate racemase
VWAEASQNNEIGLPLTVCRLEPDTAVLITEMLLAENCKTIVVACNTASALALPRLESATPIPVTGVIRPGAQAAVAATRNGHIGVIGTRATIRSGAYESALRTFDPTARITARACPLFVPLIEEGWLESEITDRIVRQYLTPLVEEGVDTLVLGCTHYPLLREAIGRFLGQSVTLVDSAQNCATAVMRLLEEEDLRANSDAVGQLSVALTDPPDAFLDVAIEALQLDLGPVQVRPVLYPRCWDPPRADPAVCLARQRGHDALNNDERRCCVSSVTGPTHSLRGRRSAVSRAPPAQAEETTCPSESPAFRNIHAIPGPARGLQGFSSSALYA